MWQAFADGTNASSSRAVNTLRMSISLAGKEKQVKVGHAYSLLIRYANTSTNESFSVSSAKFMGRFFRLWEPS
jgi:hypothetical protein